MEDSLEMSPKDAQQRLSVSKQTVLLDVREPDELILAHIEGAEVLPMGSVPRELQKLEALADSADLLVLCHHGVRSLQVVAWLRAHGIDNCFSVAGGIDRWSKEIDPRVPRY